MSHLQKKGFVKYNDLRRTTAVVVKFRSIDRRGEPIDSRRLPPPTETALSRRFECGLVREMETHASLLTQKRRIGL